MKYSACIIFLGLENAVEPRFDEIYHNGVTYPFLCSGMKEDLIYEEGVEFEYSAFLWHNEYDLESIRIEDQFGNPFKPKGLSIKDDDRSHKDLYWFYSRNQNYWREVSFIMPSHPVRVIFNYVRSKETAVLKTDLSEISGFLLKGSDKSKLSCLYCYEETANLSRHYFKEEDIYFYPIGSSMTFVFALARRVDLRLSFEGEIYPPTQVREVVQDGESVYLYTFGSLEEMDDDCLRNEGKRLLIKTLTPVAKPLV